MEHAAAHEGSEGKRRATLYVVATPIGNLRDISLRALDVLSNADAVAAEDTRITGRLLSHYGITRRLIAVHEHNERRVTGQVLGLLAEGRSIALVADAGTPAISDPGALLIAAARDAGYPVTPVPGANAAVAALSASGFAAPHFLFYGFLPARPGERKRALAAVAAIPYTLVFYEAPHRVVATLGDLRAALGGGRRIVMARELTKLFETIRACTLAEAAAWMAENPDRRRGEFVLIVEGADTPATDPGAARRILEALLGELPLSRAVELATKLSGAKKNTLYRMALEMKKGPRRGR
ncbi:MAG: 16S rRNA (cytidine(1402)-2'-O)-methyltransferase [Betaproteobacteria bacterium]|nr:16S rRNA (cytidine(1402)-2'-O)-methyltransferase [Betaproteobacteria bacterium]